MADGDRGVTGVTLSESVPPLSAMLGTTRYFEVDSAIAGARYGVWVTTPPNYEASAAARFPVIYQPDGNYAAAAFGAVHAMTCGDLINPIRPFIQVCIGYTGEDVAMAAAVRIRDLLPPGEPSWEGLEPFLEMALASGVADARQVGLWRKHAANPAADRFLAFISEELHPLIAAGWRTDEEDLGLYGYSYGGLFTAYAALTRPALFRKIGVGSPGILARRSRVFEMYDAELAAGADYAGRRLHVTLCEREITRPTHYQPVIALGAVELMARLGQTPLKGLTVTTRMVEYESHISGAFSAWYSFLRDSYSLV